MTSDDQEDRRAKYEHAMRVYEASASTVSNVGLFYVKTLVLVNGGAVVALLAMLSGVGTPVGLAEVLAAPVIVLVCGVVAALICAGINYYAMYFEQDAPRWVLTIFVYGSFVFGAAGLACFTYGAIEAVIVLGNFTPEVSRDELATLFTRSS